MFYLIRIHIKGWHYLTSPDSPSPLMRGRCQCELWGLESECLEQQTVWRRGFLWSDLHTKTHTNKTWRMMTVLVMAHCSCCHPFPQTSRSLWCEVTASCQDCSVWVSKPSSGCCIYSHGRELLKFCSSPTALKSVLSQDWWISQKHPHQPHPAW